MMEDKKEICRLLLRVLQETRAGCDLIDLVYDKNEETVKLVLVAGYKTTISVAADSGLAMIKDIIERL